MTSLDCKSSNIGPIRVNISNTGNMNKAFIGDPDCAYWDNEYPIGSDNVYGKWGIWIGADNKVSEGGPWGTPDIANEFFPSSEPWDTVWVVDRGETVDIPYWPEYTGVSDQDFVCRYNDYRITQGFSLSGAIYEGHSPLYIDVIQVTYTWTSLELIENQYWVIPKRFGLDLYFGIAGNMNAGDGFVAVGDDYCTFDYENNFAIIEDLPGGGDDWNYAGPMGFRIVSDIPDDMMNWHYHDSYSEAFFPPTDARKFNIMKGPITHDPSQTSLGFAHVYYGVGPFSIGNGDTLHLIVGQIHGQGFEGLYNNFHSFHSIKEQNYRTPSAPPMPPVRLEPDTEI